jgi:molybdopterin molybdotransferase
LVVNNTRSQFLKAKLEDGQVSILSHQNSSMLNSFSIANALIFIKDGDYTLRKGHKVDIYHI